jgi:imidazole glycerol-phosphate synthase subunit HisF
MIRIIAKLDVKPPFVVKPVHFEGLRKMGDPKTLVDKYYMQGADEIFYIDIVASLYQREILFNEIKKSAEDLYVPLAVGGGVRSVEDFTKLFHSGADKVVINTYAVQENPEIIDQAARLFGSQSVVVNVEAKYDRGNWNCYTDCGRIPSNKNVLDWVYEAQERGAGEVLLQSVDADGRKKGFDLELAAKVVDRLSIPTVVASGAGSLEDIICLVAQVKPSGIALASVLHYNMLKIAEVKKALSKVIS